MAQEGGSGDHPSTVASGGGGGGATTVITVNSPPRRQDEGETGVTGGEEDGNHLYVKQHQKVSRSSSSR